MDAIKYWRFHYLIEITACLIRNNKKKNKNNYTDQLCVNNVLINDCKLLFIFKFYRHTYDITQKVCGNWHRKAKDFHRHIRCYSWTDTYNLEPCHLIIFINDTVDMVTNVLVLLFADDLKFKSRHQKMPIYSNVP